MELKLRNKDYVPDGQGGFVRCLGWEGVLAEALFRLSCRRGSFPFLPELGSRLYLLGREKPADRTAAARQYAQEALAELPVTVEDAQIRWTGDGLCLVHVALRGEEGTANLEVTL